MPPDAGFVPSWSGPIHGFAVNAIKRMYPALCADYDFDDLLQEAYIVFMTCERRYRDTVDNPRWFMSLFRTALQNRLYSLAQKCAQTVNLDALAHEDEPVQADTNYFRQIVRELPQEIQDLLKVFSSPELPKVIGTARRRALLPAGHRGGASHRERLAAYRRLLQLLAPTLKQQ